MNSISKYRIHFFYLLGFILLSLIVFFPTTFSSPFWDDWSFIFRNYSMRSSQSPLLYFDTEMRAWPIFHSFLWLLLKYFKNNYYYYHFVSIFLHGVNGFLCWYFLNSIKIKNNLLLAIIFLVHPLQLLNIAWIIQIKTLLSIMFFLSSLILLVKFYNKKNIFTYALSVLFFAFSVFSKSTTAVFSICLLASFCFTKFQNRMKESILTILPFFFFGVIAVTKTVGNAQNQLFAIFALSIILLLLVRFHTYINIFLILPLITSISIIRFSYISDYSLFLGIPAVLFFFLTVKFNSRIKKYSLLLQCICAILCYFLLSLDLLIPELLNLVNFKGIILTIQNFIRYLSFIVFPFENYLFPKNTSPTYTSFEFLRYFLEVVFLYMFTSKFFHLKYYKVLLGILFFSIALLPFCGYFNLPIFSYSNFAPYWLSIPFIGLLPLISQLIKSKTTLLVIAFVLMGITHWQSYKFIHVENVFLESIKLSPDVKIMQVALIEHYVFTHQCREAQNLFIKMNNDEILTEFSTKNKINNCREK